MLTYLFKAHANDMLPLIKSAKEASEKPFLTIVGDDGPDMSPASYMNIFYFGRLWRDIDLTKLTAITYPSGSSAWSSLSNKLTGVTLPATLEGEELPPNKQSGLTEEELERKSAEMFDNVSEMLGEYWNNVSYDSLTVLPDVIKSHNDKGCCNDHYNINRLVYATLKSQEEDEVLMKLAKEFKFLCFHAEQRSNYVAFLKCQLLRPGNECEWCRLHPPKECKAYNYEKKINGLWFNPMPLPDHPGHFMNYLEMENCRKFDHQRDLFHVGKCSVCVNWWFSSKTEMKRH